VRIDPPGIVIELLGDGAQRRVAASGPRRSREPSERCCLLAQLVGSLFSRGLAHIGDFGGTDLLRLMARSSK
jgi:hypothetical protein